VTRPLATGVPIHLICSLEESLPPLFLLLIYYWIIFKKTSEYLFLGASKFTLSGDDDNKNGSSFKTDKLCKRTKKHIYH
jgi:hypothetical protein